MWETIQQETNENNFSIGGVLDRGGSIMQGNSSDSYFTCEGKAAAKESAAKAEAGNIDKGSDRTSFTPTSAHVEMQGNPILVWKYSTKPAAEMRWTDLNSSAPLQLLSSVPNKGFPE